MIIDARDLDDGALLEADVAIVGAGAAGITIAHELAGSGLTVLLLESGGLDFEPEVQALYEGQISGRPYFDLEACRLRFFGGSTNHWAGRCRPLDPIDFERRDWVPLSGWPFGRSALEPYYRKAHELCQLGPYGYVPAALGIDAERLLPLDPERFVSKLWQYSPPTLFGEVYRPALEAAANVRVVLHASLVEIVLEDGLGEVDRLRFRTLGGRAFDSRARACVLACGGLENPRVLLASNRQVAAGVGNQNDLVGRCFMEHPHAVVGRLLTGDPARTGFYDYTQVGFTGEVVDVLGCLSVAAEAQRARKLVNFDSSLYEDNVGAGGYAALRRIWNALERGRMPDDLVEDLKRALLDIDDTVLGILGRFDLREYVAGAGTYRLWAYLEQTPNPDSRVTLTDERDALGVPRISLAWRLSELERRSLRETIDLLAHEVGRTGVGRLQIEDWLLAGNGWSTELIGGHHHMGTTRMADDPTAGVVDASCRVHGVDNLYIAGSSVFPTSGSANPTLTVVALALRLAGTLAARLVV